MSARHSGTRLWKSILAHEVSRFGIFHDFVLLFRMTWDKALFFLMKFVKYNSNEVHTCHTKKK